MSREDGRESESRRVLRDLLDGEPDRRPRQPGGETARSPLARAWEALELPPVAPPPPGFAARVVARARGERGGAWGLPWAPAWARAAALSALLAGLAGGTGLGLVAVNSLSSDAGGATDSVLAGWGGGSLAEDFVVSASTPDDAAAGATP